MVHLHARGAERLEALLEQMTSGLCFIHHYHRGSLTLAFKMHRPTSTHTNTLYLHHSSFFPRTFITCTHTRTEWRKDNVHEGLVWGLVGVHLD